MRTPPNTHQRPPARPPTFTHHAPRTTHCTQDPTSQALPRDYAEAADTEARIRRRRQLALLQQLEQDVNRELAAGGGGGGSGLGGSGGARGLDVLGALGGASGLDDDESESVDGRLGKLLARSLACCRDIKHENSVLQKEVENLTHEATLALESKKEAEGSLREAQKAREASVRELKQELASKTQKLASADEELADANARVALLEREREREQRAWKDLKGEHEKEVQRVRDDVVEKERRWFKEREELEASKERMKRVWEEAEHQREKRVSSDKEVGLVFSRANE